jgi:hypothetical protein
MHRSAHGFLPLGRHIGSGRADRVGGTASPHQLHSDHVVVVVPVILATLAFAWWYRLSNARAWRSSDLAYEGRIEFVWDARTDRARHRR